MKRDAFLLPLLMVITSAAVRAGTPGVSQVYTITPAGARVMTANAECSNIVRRGDKLFVIFRLDDTSVSNDEYSYVRDFDLNTGVLGPMVLAGDKPNPSDIPEHGAYHWEPSILQDAIGRLICISPWYDQQFESANKYEVPPRMRTTLDLSTWSPSGALPSPFINDLWAAYGDIMGVFEANSGWTHFVGEGGNIRISDNQVRNEQPLGLSRIYYRITPQGQFDGPYYLVAAAAYIPTGQVCTLSGGNVFTKGDLVLGKEPSGNRSLHLMWNIRNSFKLPPDCSPSYFTWLNYDLYYAKSTDNGTTWTNLAGNLSPPITLQHDTRLPNSHMTYNDTRFRIYAGDLMQGAERSFDLDSQGRPVVVFVRPIGGTGTCIDVNDPDGLPVPCNSGACLDPASNCHVDFSYPAGPQYEMICRRWQGSSWAQETLGMGTGTMRFDPTCVLRVRIDRQDNIWVFASSSFNVPSSLDSMHYKVYRNATQTWSDWKAVPGATQANRFYSYADPVNPDWHYLAWYDLTLHTLKFAMLKLPSLPDIDDDNDVDQVDFGFLQRCFGSTVTLPGGCDDADFDGDATVGATDLEIFANCAAGPKVAWNRDCVGQTAWSMTSYEAKDPAR